MEPRPPQHSAHVIVYFGVFVIFPGSPPHGGGLARLVFGKVSMWKRFTHSCCVFYCIGKQGKKLMHLRQVSNRMDMK